MITQTYTQGEHKIKIESAESLKDAKENNFPDENLSRYYLNGKIIDNYQAMIRFITEEAKKNNQALIADEKDLSRTRDEILKNQNKAIREQLEKVKKQYIEMNLPESTLKKIAR